MNRDERKEGDEGAAQKETAGKTRRRRKEGTVPRTGTSGADLEQATKRQGNLRWITRGATERGRQAAQRTLAGGTEEEQAGRQQGQTVRSGNGGQPPEHKRPGHRNPGQEQSGQRGAQPEDWIVQGNGPSAKDWNIRGWKYQELEKRIQRGGEAEASDRRGRDGVAAEGRDGGREGWVEGKSQDTEGKARETEKGRGGKEYKAKP